MAEPPVSEQSPSVSTVPEEAAGGGAAVEPASAAPEGAGAEPIQEAAASASSPSDALVAHEGAPAESGQGTPPATPEGAAPETADGATDAPAAPVAATPAAPAGPSGPGEPPDDDEAEDDEEDGGGGKMSFLDHLDELRTRLVTSFGALAVGFLACFGFIEPIFDFIMQPMTAVLQEGATLLQRTGPEMFFLRLKMAALAGLLLATPIIMSQVWLFVAPGLYAHEKKFAIPFVVSASAFFITGTLFGHYVLFRVAWDFFASFAGDTDYVTFLPGLQESFSLYVRLVLACGVIFQLPTLVFFLARIGVASPQFLIRNFKYAFLLCFVFAAILTPTPDPVTMTVMAGPMIALYVLSIGIAWVFRRRDAE